jgi:DNA-binding MarR family transcriptional regulator
MTTRDQNEAYELAYRLQDVLMSLESHIPETPIDNRMVQLTLNQVRSLHLILTNPGINQKEIARILSVTPAAVSVIVRKMSDWSLIETKTSERDRRASELYLSPKGQKIYENVRKIQVKRLADMLMVLPLERQRKVVEALETASTAARSDQAG